MNRREMLKSVASGVVLAAMSGATLATDQHAHEHGMMEHAHDANPNAALIAATSAAIIKGQACLQHCIAQLSQGDKELGKCAMLSSDMLTACTAIQQLASNKSPYLTGMAEVAMMICNDCEEECRKFEKKHEVCKAAAEACAACHMELMKVAA